MSAKPVDIHEWKMRCTSCLTMVSIEWSDGNGAVAVEPKVRCINPMCSHDGALKFIEQTKQ